MPRDREREKDVERTRDRDVRPSDRGLDRDGRPGERTQTPNAEAKPEASRSAPAGSEEPTDARPRQDSEAPAVESGEEGETMDATNGEDEAMMAMMGLTGFGTTKGKHVEGNQEGAVDVKKMRTWRQYMNRRGGFNRPLDKIK